MLDGHFAMPYARRHTGIIIDRFSIYARRGDAILANQILRQHAYATRAAVLFSTAAASGWMMRRLHVPPLFPPWRTSIFAPACAFQLHSTSRAACFSAGGRAPCRHAALLCYEISAARNLLRRRPRRTQKYHGAVLYTASFIEAANSVLPLR